MCLLCSKNTWTALYWLYSVKRKNESFKNRPNRKLKERRLSEAENGGWVVDSDEAWDAYDFAAEYFGEEDLNYQIRKAMGDEELASCMAYIFRMNDFREWYAHKNGEDANYYDED